MMKPGDDEPNGRRESREKTGLALELHALVESVIDMGIKS
jgi:hypothetical protein